MIHIFCALACEAEPFIKHFKLTKLKQSSLFRLFLSKDQQTSLTITGIGKLNAAAAVSYHHASIESQTSDIWLNIGIAGHADIAIGEARLIHKITDEQDKTSWYPQILFKPICASAALITLATPSSDYQDSLYDMEASAFYQMAIRLGTAELIHSVKIISDNRAQSTATVNSDSVKKLLTAQIETIESILDSLKPLAIELASLSSEPDNYQAFIEQWHFTQSERIQLSRLLRQWQLRLADQNIMHSVANLKSGKQVLTALQNTLTNADFVIHD